MKVDNNSLLAEIQKRVANYPSLSCEQTATSIIVTPISEDGFEVSLSFDGDEYTVEYDGWHEHFKSAKAAFDCFFFGLSDQAQIKIVRRGNFDHHWTLECLENDRWIADSAVGLLFFPFWRKPQVRYKRNTAITGKPNFECPF